MSRSDFILTKILCKTYQRNLSYLEDDWFREGDALIMSFPYSGNGSYYPEYENVLDTCDQLNIPVFIDGAYFGISKDINYPLQHDCVKDFSVSLSKNIAGNPLRLAFDLLKKKLMMVSLLVCLGVMFMIVWEHTSHQTIGEIFP